MAELTPWKVVWQLGRVFFASVKFSIMGNTREEGTVWILRNDKHWEISIMAPSFVFLYLVSIQSQNVFIISEKEQNRPVLLCF